MKAIYFVVPICLWCILLGCLIDIAGLMSLGLLLITSWLLMAGGALYIALLALHRFRLVNRKPAKALILVPVLLAACGASGVLGMLLSTRDPVLSGIGVPAEDELKYMFEMDQSDRYSGRLILLPHRDTARLVRTREIIRRVGDSLPGEAKYHAAMIFQHGETASDFEWAYLLATSASESGVVQADGLSKAAYDRWQLSLGKPQKYDTQSKFSIGITGINSESTEPSDD